MRFPQLMKTARNEKGVVLVVAVMLLAVLVLVGFTAAMNTLAKQGRLNAVDFIGNRFDMGNKLGILKANCEMGLRHPELKDDFKAYLKELVSKL